MGTKPFVLVALALSLVVGRSVLSKEQAAPLSEQRENLRTLHGPTNSSIQCARFAFSGHAIRRMFERQVMP